MGANDMQAVTIHRPTKVAVPQGDWTVEAIQALLDKPLMDLLFEAQTVQAGEKLAVIEAMKMENVLFATHDGVVGKISADKGESLSVDQIILEFN